MKVLGRLFELIGAAFAPSPARSSDADWLLSEDRPQAAMNQPRIFYPDGSTDVVHVFGPPSLDFHGNHLNDF